MKHGPSARVLTDPMAAAEVPSVDPVAAAVAAGAIKNTE
jgi:hypothetical protein